MPPWRPSFGGGLSPVLRFHHPDPAGIYRWAFITSGFTKFCASYTSPRSQLRMLLHAIVASCLIEPVVDEGGIVRNAAGTILGGVLGGR